METRPKMHRVAPRASQSMVFISPVIEARG
jgi:hypothetical protein